MYDITGYHEAQSLDDVFALSAQYPHTRLIAGGTDVLVKSRDRAETYIDTELIGISRIPELHGIKLDNDGTLVIGAMSAFTDVELDPLVQKHAPLLSYAVSTVGGPQTRHAGTIGGNVCNAGTAADSAPTLFAYNAICEVHSKAGVEDRPIASMYAGPGKNTLKPGEILVKIKITKDNYEGYVGHYTKFAQRMALDIANLSCATLVKVGSDQKIEDLRICFGAAAPTPVRMNNAEAYGKGQQITDSTLAEIGNKCLEDTSTIADWRASKAYRDHLVTVLPGRNIKTALGED